MQLKIDFEKTLDILREIKSKEGNQLINEKDIEQYWIKLHIKPNGNNGKYGEMTPQAFNFLYCWFVTDGKRYRDEIEKIFSISFKQIFEKDKDLEFYKWTTTHRYKPLSKDDLKNELDKLNLKETTMPQLNKNDNEEYIELLKANHNLILTGAPGTGKTFLTKQIGIKLMFKKDSEQELTPEEKTAFENHYRFVQFHPSYDYTDFVEGLRPTPPDENGNIGFKRQDGVFKDFCKKAIIKDQENNFDEVYDSFLKDLSNEENKQFETPKQKNKFIIHINSKNSCEAIPLTDAKTKMTITKDILKNYVLFNKIPNYYTPYITAIGNYIKDNYPLNIINNGFFTNIPFVFVIDEINRGEISKIFGELFFSIDPGYRKEKDIIPIKTQYQNMIDDKDDPFFNGFYIPDNVYIIGTMNDIDRSVESFDFAMRRRFVWKEVKTDENLGMLDKLPDNLKNQAIEKLIAINKEIEKIPELGTAYQIGGAYFKKLENYLDQTDPFIPLWKYHLEPLLSEYLRGKSADQIKESWNKLKSAYGIIDENDR